MAAKYPSDTQGEYIFLTYNCYRPHPKDAEGNSFSFCVSSHPRWGVPTLVGGYLPWSGGTYLGWGVPNLATGVPTLVGGTYLGCGGTYLGQEGYLPWPWWVPTFDGGGGRGYTPWTAGVHT